MIATPTPIQQFLPATQVPLVATNIPLASLPPDDALACDLPDPALVADIAALGVLQPVILMGWSDGSYIVCDGRSRIRAARAAGLTHIPAMVAPSGHIAPSAVGAKANALRRDNPRTRLAFIEEAAAAGLDDRTTCRVGGFSVAELRAARRLLDLIPALRTALDEGRIRASVAREAAALTPGQQKALAAILDEAGHLHVTDVRRARRVERVEAAVALPQELFATPDASGDWRAYVRLHLQEAFDATPEDEDAVREAIASALASLDMPSKKRAAA